MRCVSYVWLALGPALCPYADAAWPLQPSAHTWDGRTNESIGMRDVQQQATTGRNLLYIISDDLRSELGRVNLQPSFQKLMDKSMMFDRTFVQQAVCNPSRQSFLTARRPDKTGVWNMKSHVRDLFPNAVSFPGAFKNAGFETCGVGKVFHHSEGSHHDWSCDDDWYDPKKLGASKISDLPDNSYEDGMAMDRTLEKLSEFASKGKPFMWTVGLRKPHLAWFYPKRFLDLNKGEPAPEPLPPRNACNYSLYECTERVRDIPHHTPYSPLPAATQAKYRQQYRGAVTWVSYVVGNIVDHLEKVGLADNTMLIFHGDNGWNLGDHGMWCKQSNFETTTRAPLLFHVPWLPQTFGVRTNAMVEMIDVMPTALELMGLTETVRDRQEWDGVSFGGLLADPSKRVWKNATFSQYQRCGAPEEGFTFAITDPCEYVPTSEFRFIGHSIRTDESSSIGAWRYTVWVKWDPSKLRPQWDEVVGEELYSHDGDAEPDIDASFERVNVASEPSAHGKKAALRAALLAHAAE
jgi:iduronate 2-sulfatase